jgi:S-adenosylmethionine-diacylglycerol 3-amino-3-carboxypropyl transferase
MINLLFQLIHGHRLIYNACWEDPRLDRQLLNLDGDSEVVVITSAGCNTLDYLLDGPKAIHAVDVNFRQNALLDLKLAFFRSQPFGELYAFFGNGHSPTYRETYRALRDALSPLSRAFWDRKIDYFSGRGSRRSFYWRGAAGDFAWLLRRLVVGQGRKAALVQNLLNAQSLAEQRHYYEQLEGHLFTRPISWLLRQPATMALIGVPRAQVRLLDRQYTSRLDGFVRDKLRQVMTELPIQDNYFWRVYLTGSYTPTCCPNYLKPENFPHLQSRVDRVSTHTCTLTEFLRRQPGCYSHFVLLDHQDWLAWHQPQVLAEEWQAIFTNSRPGTKILLRSAGFDLSFLPASVLARLRFFPERTEPLHSQDRVGTYGSLHLAEVL